VIDSMSITASSDLDFVFHPRSVAVVGASASFGEEGRKILSNIMHGQFNGKIFAVNPREEMTLGLPSFKSVEEVPQLLDLVVITAPAETLLPVLQECGKKGVKAVLITTSGFDEESGAGRDLESHAVSLCHEIGAVLIGPSTVGIFCSKSGLLAIGTHIWPLDGKVAFVSQSGDLGKQLLHWATLQGVGVSIFAGSGSEAMVTVPDYMEYLECDKDTRVIVLYLERLPDVRRFFDIAKRINRTKPIILLKKGRTKAGIVASGFRRGARGDESNLFTAACRQAGMLEVSLSSHLLDLAAGFSSLPLPKGNRVGIVTLGGGWGVVTADICNEMGLTIPDLPEKIIEVIGHYLPTFWSRRNPIDLVGTQNREVPLVAVEELLKWNGIDAVISLGVVGRLELARQLIRSTKDVDTTMPLEFLEQTEAMIQQYEKSYIERLVELMEIYEKPVLNVSLVATKDQTVRYVPAARYNAVIYRKPESAVNVLTRMYQYSSFLAKSL
jgi:acyl-CoA synthetase (NDP forming)